MVPDALHLSDRETVRIPQRLGHQLPGAPMDPEGVWHGRANRASAWSRDPRFARRGAVVPLAQAILPDQSWWTRRPSRIVGEPLSGARQSLVAIGIFNAYPEWWTRRRDSFAGATRRPCSRRNRSANSRILMSGLIVTHTSSQPETASCPPRPARPRGAGGAVKVNGSVTGPSEA
jgi:hypothetical protein